MAVVNYGITADDLERFLHFFIALDALFGEMGKVEETIINGIKRTFPGDSKWLERAEMLFDLRSELVHGGSSFIDDWKSLDHYRRHFQSHPLTDVGTAAMTALRNYFNFVPAFRFSRITSSKISPHEMHLHPKKFPPGP